MRDDHPRVPELGAIALELEGEPVVLDGELVAFDDQGGRASSGSSGACTSAREPSRGAARRRPVTYVIFDLLHLDGESLLGLPYEERRERLEALALDGASWQTPAYHRGDGAAMLALSQAQGLEGIVAKRLDSLYRPGRRSRDWLKVKNVRGQEVVIGGWLPGKGRRDGEVGALLVGYYEGEGEERRLRFAGKVGTGFSEESCGCSASGSRRCAATRARSRAASRRRTRSSRNPSWSPRSSSPSGRTPGRCATPPSRACATTSPPDVVREEPNPSPGGSSRV